MLGQGAPAKAFNFTANIPGPNATLVVTMFFIKENSSIKICDGSEYEVLSGSVKFNIEIKGWTFCDIKTCGKNGEYIEVKTLVKAPKDKKAKLIKKENTNKGGDEERGNQLILDNAVMKFPSAVEADDSCTTMAASYPKFTTQGIKEVATYRFKKFSRFVIYDPIVEPMPSPPPASASTIKLSVLVTVFAFLVKLLA